jgi:hypothetical protein
MVDQLKPGYCVQVKHHSPPHTVYSAVVQYAEPPGGRDVSNLLVGWIGDPNIRGVPVWHKGGDDAPYTGRNMLLPDYTHGRWVSSSHVVGIISLAITKPAAAKVADLSDWRTWRDHGLQPGECVCKMPRALCTFHKDG